VKIQSISHFSEKTGTAIVSEKSLARKWDKTEEDEA
jgi:hypothetical protein